MEREMILDSRSGRHRTVHRSAEPLAARLRNAAHPLGSAADLNPLLDAIGDARFVLLGEATHGTSEFYTWRTEISRRLIREKGFSFIAVEGDWPDCYRVNRYVKWLGDAGSSAEEVLHAFARWPTWMWADREIVELTQWLRSTRHERPSAGSVRREHRWGRCPRCGDKTTGARGCRCLAEWAPRPRR